MNSSNIFTEREMLDDSLSSQKYITENYNMCANEASTPAIKSEFMNILSEEHQIQHDVFTEMQKRGWYVVEQAEQNKITQAKLKFSQVNS